MASEERQQILEKIDGAIGRLDKKDMTYLIGFGDGLAAAAMMEPATEDEQKNDSGGEEWQSKSSKT